MPKRIKNESKEQGEFSYDDLLVRIRTHIDEKYGGVAKFLQHEDYKECGFEDTEHSKMYIYLSLPLQTEGGKEDKQRVKSFPTLQKLYKTLLGVETESRIKVTRTQILTGDKELIDAMPVYNNGL